MKELNVPRAAPNSCGEYLAALFRRPAKAVKGSKSKSFRFIKVVKMPRSSTDLACRLTRIIGFSWKNKNWKLYLKGDGFWYFVAWVAVARFELLNVKVLENAVQLRSFLASKAKRLQIRDWTAFTNAWQWNGQIKPFITKKFHYLAVFSCIVDSGSFNVPVIILNGEILGIGNATDILK